MATNMTVHLPNRPGTLADLGEALGNAGINIAGGAQFIAEGRGEVHILVDDVAAARKAIEGAGLKVSNERDVLVMDITDQPGALGKVARRMANAGVNIELVYLTAAGQLVLGVDDPNKARSA
jgi:hypothetical protein